ncbi:MAG: hypothetical protein J7501_08550 [Bdellovibrio sp.]|nr:hypothetical protein [Bdellovibrio sp.]
MRIRYSFLSRIVIAALTSQAMMVHPVFAGDDVGVHTPLSIHLHSNDSEWEKHNKAQMGIWAQQVADAENAAYANYQKIENGIIQNPMAALDNLVKVANHNARYAPVFAEGDSDGPLMPLAHGEKNVDRRLFEIGVKYVKSMPQGQVSSVELSQGTGDKVLMTIIAHEKAKTNPFILLESMVNLNDLYTISDISASSSKLKAGYNPHHHGYHAYDTAFYNLADTLGVTGIDKSPTYSHHDYTIIAPPPPTPIEVSELRANAAAGSVLSQRKLAELETKSFQAVKKSFAKFLPLKNMDEAQKKSALAEYAQLKGVQVASGSYDVMLQSLQDQIDLKNKHRLDALNIAAKKVYKQQMDDYKAGAAEREQVVQTKSLPEMVKANDRAGVADAMEKMLPWSIMEPSEKLFWRDYVDAVRTPNYDNAPILFRGIDKQEKLQALTDSSGKVIGGGLFSKRLTAGSGSHLFKLKGLVETFETFGTDGVNTTAKKAVSPLNQPHTLTKMMMNHAANPQGSPFLSLTFDLQVAYNFSTGDSITAESPAQLAKITPSFLNSNASGGLATIRIDKRRLITNSVSGFASEVEVLASMLIFPDEVLLLEKGIEYYTKTQDNNAAGNYRFEQVKRMTEEQYYEKARSVVYQKTGVVLPQTYQELAQQGTKAFFDGLNDMEARLRRVNPNQPLICSKVFQ